MTAREHMGSSVGELPAEDPGEFLSARDITVSFYGIVALDSISLSISKGEILGLIGPNGAGKTTMLNVLTGYQAPTSGSIDISNEDITGKTPAELSRLGVTRTFQSTRLFEELSVRENIEVAGISSGCSATRARRDADEILDRLELSHRADLKAGSLPYGEERRLSIGRALGAHPRFLLLDEPAAGLNETESDSLLGMLRGIHADLECGLLVVEHDMRLMTRLCKTFHVLDHGATIGTGSPAEMRADQRVLEAYLGSAKGQPDA